MERSPKSRLLASPQLHTPSCWESRDTIAGRRVREVVAEVVSAVRIVARKIKEIDAGEDDEETAKEGDGVYSRRRVEALEEEERGYEGAGCERYVVEGVNTSAD
jgi:hypothetical protein